MGYRIPGQLVALVDQGNDDVHTCHDDSAWVNRIAASRTLSRHSERDDAVVAGRQFAMQRRTALVVHRKDGSIEFREDYRA